jgi:hypothetical protein
VLARGGWGGCGRHVAEVKYFYMFNTMKFFFFGVDSIDAYYFHPSTSSTCQGTLQEVWVLQGATGRPGLVGGCGEGGNCRVGKGLGENTGGKSAG